MGVDKHSLREVAFWLGTAALSAALCLVSFRHMLPSFGTLLIGEHNDALYSFNTLVWHWQMLGELRLTSVLDAPIMAPLPHGHAYGDNLFALALLAWPVAAAAGELFAHNLLVLSTFVLCAIFGAGFGRALTGSGLAGLVVGLCFAFVPIRLQTLHELNNLATMWLALAAWALVRWHETQGWKWLGLGLVAVVGQFLSSIQLLIHFVLLTAVWLVWLWACARFRFRRHVVVQSCALVAVALPLLAPWALVYGRVRAFMPGFRSTDEMHMYTPPASEWLARLWPGDVLMVLFGIAVALLLVGQNARLRQRLHAPDHPHLAPLVVAALLGFVMGQGPFFVWDQEIVSLPYHWLSQLYPLLKTIRAPQRVQRVVVLFASGGAGIAVVWLIGWLRRGVEAWSRRWPLHGTLVRVIPAVPALLAVVVLALEMPPATARTRALPLPAVANALRELPADALVFPVPLFLNWPRRPPLDHMALVTRAHMVGGYGGAIPALFWSIMRQVGTFPEPRALEVIRATGATHIMVNGPALSREQLAGVRDLERAGVVTSVHVGPAWQLWQLRAPATRRVFDPFEQPAGSFAIRGPSAVAPGQRVTLALDAPVGRTVLDPVYRRRVAVETLDAEGRLAGIQRADLFSPQVLEPGGFPYQLSLDAPSWAGSYRVRVLWPPCPPCADRSLEFGLEVQEDLETSAAHPSRAYQIADAGEQTRSYRGQALRYDFIVENRDRHVWLARPEQELPAELGAIMLHATLRGPRSMHRAYPPWQGFHLLPHDLAPGDRTTTRQYLDGPDLPGDYELTVSVGPHHVPQGTGKPFTVGVVHVD